MKSFIVLALFVAAAVAAPAGPLTADSEAVVLKQSNDNIGVGGYNHKYETSNGINQEETAQLKNVGTENEGIEVRGQYSYLGPDGVLYAVTYIANAEVGFQPQGAHLPQVPQ